MTHFLRKMSENDVLNDIRESVEETFLEEEDELSWEDIQRLTAAFVVCVLGTAAHKGSIFWTSMFFLSIILCGIWWASDKTDQIVHSLTKEKPPHVKYQYHDEF